MKTIHCLLIAALSTLVTFSSAQQLPLGRFNELASSTDYGRTGAATKTAASFPGGQIALYSFLASAVEYPEAARSLGMEGTVRVQVRVRTDGSFGKVRIIQSAGKLFDQAVLNAVAKMPRWLPAQSQGKTVAYWIDFPVTFRLD